MAGQQNPNYNLELVKKLYDEVYTKGNLNRLDHYFTNDVKQWDTAGTDSPQGLEALKDKEMQYKSAFPNKTVNIDNIWAWDDKVVVCWTAVGTHKGNYKGIPPTNHNLEVSGISIYHCANGKITFIQQNWDRLLLLEQLGLVDSSQVPHYHH